MGFVICNKLIHWGPLYVTDRYTGVRCTLQIGTLGSFVQDTQDAPRLDSTDRRDRSLPASRRVYHVEHPPVRRRTAHHAIASRHSLDMALSSLINHRYPSQRLSSTASPVSTVS